MRSFFVVLIEKIIFILYNWCMENIEINEKELFEKLEKVEAKKQEINENLSKMTEEELAEYMMQSIKESVEFAKKNDIEIIECGD